MDAQFVRGMMKNPNMQLNAAINRWIAAIQLFDFKLVHVPAEKHTGADSLSRREPVPGEDDEEIDSEEWVDSILSLGIWVDSLHPVQAPTTKNFKILEKESSPPSPDHASNEASRHDLETKRICEYLINPTQGDLTTDQHTRIQK